MGARSGAALKFLQWFLRGIQFMCAALILGVYSYFLAALANHNLSISNDIRAVEGISGAAVLYTIAGLLLVCCLAGFAFTAFIAMVLDLAFAGAFIYVAVANKHGAGSCRGYLDTPFGKGQDNKVANGNDGFTALPSFHTACRLQTACLAVAIIAVFFFIFSMLTELALARHHRKEKRFGPGPDNNYTSGYAKEGGLFARMFGRGRHAQEDEDNVLPAHVTPDQLNGQGRQSYAATDGTAPAVGNPDDRLYGNGGGGGGGDVVGDYPKYETGYGYTTSNPAAGGVAPGAGGAYELYGGGRTGYAPPPQQYSYAYEDGTYDRS